MLTARAESLEKTISHSTRDAANTRAREASAKVSPDRSSVFEGMHPQYGHSPPTSSRSTTASDRPLSLSPPAIASPATPPPRHTTSNSCGNLLTSIRGRVSQRLQKQRRGESTNVALALVDAHFSRR